MKTAATLLFLTVLSCPTESLLAACPTQAPATVKPADGSVLPSPVVFEWTPVSGAETYFLSVWDDVTGADVFGQETTGTTLSVSLPPGNYGWVVDAEAAGCEPKTSLDWYFIVPLANCPQPANLLSPPEDSVQSASVHFEWSPVDGASGYDFYLYREDDLVTENTLTTTSIDLFLQPGSYDWGVDVNLPGCGLLESSSYFFVASGACPSQVPTNLRPANDSLVASPVVFEWTPVSDSEAYFLYVFNDNTGEDVLELELSGTTHTANLPPGNYGWTVETVATGCEPRISEEWYFIVPRENCPPPSDLLSPLNDSAVASPVTFRWTAEEEAERYHLYVFDDVSGMDVFDQELTQATATVTLPPGNYGWGVETSTAGCETESSEEWYFIVPLENCPEAPELQSPPEASTQSSSVHFEWAALGGVSEYYFYLFRDGELIRDEALTATSIDLELGPGTYDWGVDVNLGGCGLLESYSYFFIPGGECPEDGPEIESPALFQEVSSHVEFRWKPVEGASSYWFYLENEAGDVLADQLVSSTVVPFDLLPEEYYWSVEAEVPGCPYTASEGFFRVTCGKGAPELVGPADGVELTSPAEFTWTAVAGTEGYYLVILLHGEYYFEEFVEETSLEVELPGGDLEWFVEAVYEEGCPPESSESRTFEVAGGEDCPTAGPQLLAPAAGATITSTPIEFSWTPVQGAFEYWIAVAEGDGDFEIVDFTDLTSSLVALGPGRYEWKVVALLEGCLPVESAIGSFEFPGDPSCEPDFLELVSPQDDAVVSGPVVLEWNPVQDAVEYIVFLESLDGYPTPIATTQETSLHLDSLPSGEYFWWVFGILPACAPSESDYRYFEVSFDLACDHEPPFPLNPPEGASNVPSDMTFEWAAVPEATGYQVWTSVDGSDFVPIGTLVTEPRLAATVPVGRIEWFVEALFTGCPSETSEEGTFFSIEDQADCGIKVRPELALVGSVQSGQNYVLYWTPVPGAESYEVQESKDERFLLAGSVSTAATSASFTTTSTQSTLRHYRVRAIDRCGQPGPFSSPAVVVIEPPRRADAAAFDLVTGVSELSPVSQSLFIPGSGSASKRSFRASASRGRPVRRPEVGATFSVTTDVPWLRAVPSNGNLPPDGATIRIEADPSRLPAGAFSGNVNVATSGAGKGASDGSTVPVTVSIVTPVGSGTANTIPPETLVIPVVRGGSDGSSDVEISNLSPVKRTWEIQFVPTGVDGFRRARKTTVQLEPGSTIALADLMRTWFGFASGTDVEGSLSVRPLDSETNALGSGATFLASSLLRGHGAQETLSAIPSIALGRFLSAGAGGSPGRLVVPDIRSGTGTSTTLKLVEGGGSPVTASVKIIGSDGQTLAESSVALEPFEQRSLASLLDGITAEGARAEITVSSGGGRVSAVGVVRDARSGDERIVRSLGTDRGSTERVILGVASGSAGKGRSRSTSLWLYNSTEEPAPIELRFVPEGGLTDLTGGVTLAPGTSRRVDDVTSILPGSGGRGIIVISAAPGVLAEASLSTRGAGGELSTQLPVIAAERTTKVKGRSLQILHMETSAVRSSGLGLAELDGAEVTVEVSAVVPGSKLSPSTMITLGANEIRTVESILEKLGISGAGRARLVIRVRAGGGRVAAWGAITDRSTLESTVIGAE